MNIKLLALLIFFFATSANAQEPTILNHMAVNLQGSTLDSYTQRLIDDGYTQKHDPAFTQANLRVFAKKSQRGQVVFMLAYCNNQLTGMYTHLSQSENLIVTLDIDKYNYKLVKDAVDKYRKGAITIDLITDPSVVYKWGGSSDTYGEPRKYIYMSAANNCHSDKLESPLAPYFSFSPGSLDQCLQILKSKKNEVVIAMAKSAFFENGKDATGNVVQYAKDRKTVTMQYCQDAVAGFMALVEKSDGKNLEASLKKEGFKLKEETTGADNMFARAYETENYLALLHYFGDVEDEEDRDYAYRLVFSKKQNPCIK